MLLRTDRDTLLSPLAAVCGVVERRHTLPVLSHALLEADGEQLKITVSDLEIQLECRRPLPTALPFRLCVPARKLLDILRALPAGCELQLRLQGGQLLLSADGSRFQLQTLPADDFPLWAPDSETPMPLTLRQGQLKRKLDQVLYAMAASDIRPYLNALLLQLDGDQLCLIASDGVRLAFQRYPLPQAMPERKLLLPRKAALELNKLLLDQDQPLALEFGARQLACRLNDTVLRCKLVDARAPDYLRLLPDSHDCELSLPRQAMLEAVQRVAVLAHAKFRQLELAIRPGQLALRCRNAERELAEEHLPLDWQGEPLEASFNLAYLQDVLQSQKAEQLHFGFARGMRGVLITAPDEPDFRYLAMPLRG
ncbi:DNA polymerase III subunit beta [Chromobacterium sp. IIBBL 290-4]|uniref:DNA polymerase III subunit beta n=1 Tax=Chromobacterium sp. IIBBL 290-4 TaxID=2953890 RepID=UPI0020B84E00|nr:DNA polymerase III subunit beta [Chromobacterium sp. IIBBL 290-4]UTH75457.1 DNA polymerase III subunit beta [Chromobacterium sp. IIBBL 290-4]